MKDDAVFVRNRSLASGIPLGGLGTGSVEIRDDGRFHDWEICNNNLWSGNPAHKPPEMWSEDACFAVRVKQEGAKHPVVRLLYDDDKRSEAISLKHDYCRIYNFPFLWNIERIAYRGRHPFADLAYTDSRLPLDIRLRAFSPFIPHNAKDSALPLAFFAFTVKNTGTIPCETSLMFSLRNFTGYDRQEQRLRNNVAKDDASVGIFMTADGMDPSDRTFGSVMASALDPDATWVTAWGDDRGLEGFPGAHTPGCGQTFQSFRDTGTLPCTPESWERVEKSKRTEDPQRVITDNRDRIHHWRGSLCSKVILQPGEQREIVFMMSWFFPNHYYRHMPDGLMARSPSSPTTTGSFPGSTATGPCCGWEI